jgi:hypothetical protein
VPAWFCVARASSSSLDSCCRRFRNAPIGKRHAGGVGFCPVRPVLTVGCRHGVNEFLGTDGTVDLLLRLPRRLVCGGLSQLEALAGDCVGHGRVRSRRPGPPLLRHQGPWLLPSADPQQPSASGPRAPRFETGPRRFAPPRMAYAANSAWQQLVVLTHNLLTNFQIHTGAGRRAPSRKRTVLHRLQSVQTLRFVLFHRAAQLVRPGGTTVLRLTNNPATRETFTRLADALARTG